MKKLLALLLAAVMVLSLFAGCSSSSTEDTASDSVESADDIPDEMTSDDGIYPIAMVTDVGQLKDKSFNQGTYDGVKLYANSVGKAYKYYQPSGGSEATDDDRIDAMKLACDNGAEVVVCPGYLQENALREAAAAYPDVKFVFIDGSAIDLANVAAISFREEQAGYLAGYAAVMEGYTKLGFCGGGGGTNAACDRYGYGFVQGADAAAAAKGVTIEINYSWLYGSSFSASAELQTMADGWYQNGTEVIFACGGSMFDSVAAAASAEDGKVIGVDSDQSYDSDTVITSAMKGLSNAAQEGMAAAESDESWTAFNGDGTAVIKLGAAEGAVGLPTDTWSLENWTVEEYEALLADIIAGTVTIDDSDVPEPASTANTTVNIIK